MLVPRSPLQRRLQVVPVLHVDRLVEPVLVLGSARSSSRRRPLAEQRLRRRARQRADPGEEEDREPEQDRDEQQQPADDEAQASSSAGCSRSSPT